VYIEDWHTFCKVLGIDPDTGEIEALRESVDLDDGIYEVQPWVSILDLSKEYNQVKETIQAFLVENPQWRFACAYQTGVVLLLSEPPIARPDLHTLGSGFNYGSTNLLENCPSRILILAQDD
jgi:hypothetical protein